MYLAIILMILVVLLGISLLKMAQFERIILQKALANLGSNPATFTNIRLEIKRLKQSGDKDIRGFYRTIWILTALMVAMLLLAWIALFQAA
ncbi:hypothetical protein [Alysiella filiformis]|uniref:Uncharacterized protein n=1 Tax=Alysiella filiformis DSM 16848 TaxID=1120981 RepID=A0A286E3A2_9NEIS|nr:hypothetical protein [Alysiella filiformis]QMT31117.1 hypothetical protein H3L97_10420 [Alysiella filiformis]UBQ55891.1 hypothetical protein JF568_10050 [Alysiella filiformis DSM 16848]SOD65375.1 hypothetical protein SAMN02746062_00267 [Alysiella filiformis DSM 16848]